MENVTTDLYLLVYHGPCPFALSAAWNSCQAEKQVYAPLSMWLATKNMPQWSGMLRWGTVVYKIGANNPS